MADPVRIGLDGCELPTPIDGTQEFLAAILDELRALRTGEVPTSDDGETAPAPEVEPVPQPVMVSEPGVVALPAEMFDGLEPGSYEMQVRARTAAPEEDQAKPKRQPRKPRGRKA